MRNKGTNSTPGERSKVRVVMVEFEGTSGDLQQLAQTLANAVRPQQVAAVLPQQRVAPALSAAPSANGQSRDLFSDLPEEEETVALAPEPADERPTPPKPANGQKKKLKTPSVIEDIDFTSQPHPFKEFMAELGVDEHGRRYLGITQWFKEHRQILEIGADHIYTCYKFLGLAVPEDVTAAFRALKRAGAVASGSARGMYRITHIGENTLTETRNEE